MYRTEAEADLTLPRSGQTSHERETGKRPQRTVREVSLACSSRDAQKGKMRLFHAFVCKSGISFVLLPGSAQNHETEKGNTGSSAKTKSLCFC